MIKKSEGRFLLLLFSVILTLAILSIDAFADSNSNPDTQNQENSPIAEAQEFLNEMQNQPKTSEGFQMVSTPFVASTLNASNDDEEAPIYFDPKAAQAKDPSKPTMRALPGGRIKMSGSYRMSAGISTEEFLVNKNFPNDNFFELQGPTTDYLFGRSLNNTYDPAIYSQYVLNVEFTPIEKGSFYVQMVNDPWSYVGQTGEQVAQAWAHDESQLRYNLKSFGASNYTLSEVYRSSDGDRFNIPRIKIKDGRTTNTTIEGLDALYGVDGDKEGYPINIGEIDMEYRYQPIRKFWFDYKEDQWQVRIFPLADETQAYATDDPLQLSNHKDYWEPSPWLYQYKTYRNFYDINSVESIRRGHYSDTIAFIARDSQGNRLVLLRGVSFEGTFDKTYFASTIASPVSPWDDYTHVDNVPMVFRLKHNFTDKFMLGAVSTQRIAMVDSNVADHGHVEAVDAKYQVNDNITVKGEVAYSCRERDILTYMPLEQSITNTGFAYKTVVESKTDRDNDGKSQLQVSFTQMDQGFQPLLSTYTQTRSDAFWGTHLSFDEYKDLEPFRIGDGVDINRTVYRVQWKESAYKERFYNLFDARNVHRTSSGGYLETVIRDEMKYHFDSRWVGKGLFRWRGMPKSSSGAEPAIVDYYFTKDDIDDPTDIRIQNVDVKDDKDANQFTYSAGLQFLINKQWTAEGIVERTNAVPDFPRGLMDDYYRDVPARVDGILLDRMVNFMYGQAYLKGAPRYDYFTIWKERLIYKPMDNLKFIAHATQNGYKFAGGIDDNINHVGLSTTYDYSKKISFFSDYTFSQQIDIPHLIATNYATEEYRSHNNFYAGMDYHINLVTLLRAEYGVFGFGKSTPHASPYSATSFSLPTIDTEHLFRLSLTGDF